MNPGLLLYWPVYTLHRLGKDKNLTACFLPKTANAQNIFVDTPKFDMIGRCATITLRKYTNENMEVRHEEHILKKPL